MPECTVIQTECNTLSYWRSGETLIRLGLTPLTGGLAKTELFGLLTKVLEKQNWNTATVRRGVLCQVITLPEAFVFGETKRYPHRKMKQET